MNRNSIVFGMLYALIGSVLGFFFWRVIFQLFSEEQLDIYFGLGSLWDLRTVSLLAVAGNIIFVQVFRSRRFYESMRGTMIFMAILAICWFIYFRESFLIS